MQDNIPTQLHPARLTSAIDSNDVLSRTDSSWKMFLNESQRTHALDTALSVAERFKDPDTVYAATQTALKQTQFPTMWAPYSLTNGFGGIALMYEYLDRCFPAAGWNIYAQRYMQLTAASTHQLTIAHAGLSAGVAGMAMVLSFLQEREPRYQKTLERLTLSLSEQVLHQQWYDDSEDWEISERDYDVMSGASGILAYLLRVEQPDEAVKQAIKTLLSYLLWLAEPEQALGEERWYISPRKVVSPGHRERCPQGLFNYGLAHGMAGPLAVLSLAYLAGERLPGLAESIAYLADWLLQHALHDQWGMNWPDVAPLHAASSPQAWQALPPTRAAWCYGVPGIARSLWLAGQALQERSLCQNALLAIESVLHRPQAERGIIAPILCHGVAGLLHICLRFAQETENATLHQHIPVLTEQIFRSFNSNYALGFRDVEHAGVFVDQPGWLTGAPGVVMVLLSVSTSVLPTWDRLLLLS